MPHAPAGPWRSWSPPAGVQLPAGGTGLYAIPGFPVGKEQEKSNWCWAAVCSAILHAAGRPTDQRQVVAQVQGAAALDQDNPELIAAALDRFGLNPKIVAGLALSMLPFDPGIKGPIDRNHPLAITIKWPNGAAHIICAFGYGTLGGIDALMIYDPAIGEDPDNVTLVTLAGMDAYAPDPGNPGKRGYWRNLCVVGEG